MESTLIIYSGTQVAKLVIVALQYLLLSQYNPTLHFKAAIVIMKQNFDRTKLHPKIVNEDIIKWRTDEKFDFILIDAPCSATGTIRKNPDLIHIKDKKDINSHINTQ